MTGILQLSDRKLNNYESNAKGSHASRKQHAEQKEKWKQRDENYKKTKH